MDRAPGYISLGIAMMRLMRLTDKRACVRALAPFLMRNIDRRKRMAVSLCPLRIKSGGPGLAKFGPQCI